MQHIFFFWNSAIFSSSSFLSNFLFFCRNFFLYFILYFFYFLFFVFFCWLWSHWHSIWVFLHRHRLRFLYWRRTRKRTWCYLFYCCEKPERQWRRVRERKKKGSWCGLRNSECRGCESEDEGSLDRGEAGTFRLRHLFWEKKKTRGKKKTKKRNKVFWSLFFNIYFESVKSKKIIYICKNLKLVNFFIEIEYI